MNATPERLAAHLFADNATRPQAHAVLSVSPADFVSDFSKALVMETVNRIREDQPNISTAINSFASGVTLLDGERLAETVTDLRVACAHQFPSLSTQFHYVSDTRQDVKVAIANLIAAHPTCTQDQLKHVVDGLSQGDAPHMIERTNVWIERRAHWSAVSIDNNLEQTGDAAARPRPKIKM